MAEREYLGAVQNPDREILGSVTVSAPPADDFYISEGGAAFGRPKRGQASAQAPKPLESLGAGITKSVVDPFVGTAQLLSGGKVGNELAQRLGQQGEFYSEQDPYLYGAGRIAGAVIPGTAAVKGAGLLPSMNKYLQASALGAGGGLITPEETGKTGLDFYTEQAKKGTIGAVAAPLLTGGGDLLGYAGKLGKRLIEPFTEAGKEKIVGRALTEAAGGEAEKAIQNIRNYTPTIKGSLPTMSEIARVPSLAALERSAIANNPEVANVVAGRNEARNLLRKDFLEDLAGMGGQKEALIQARKATADLNYEKAFNEKMAFKEVPKELLAQKDELLQSPAVQKAIAQAKETLANQGKANINPTQSIQGLHEVKLAMDDQIAKLTKPDMTTSETNKINGIKAAKDRLVGFLESESISPTYKKARQIYAAQSKPINELEAVEKIAEKVINPATDAIYPNQLARQLKNAEKGKTVGQNKLDQLKAFQEDIRGQEFARQAGKSTGSDTAQKLAYSNLMNDMGVPNALKNSGIIEGLGNFAGQLGNMAYSNANQRLSSKLANAVTDPQEAARLMELVRQAKANPSKISKENKRLIELLGAETAVQYNPFSPKGALE